MSRLKHEASGKRTSRLSWNPPLGNHRFSKGSIYRVLLSPDRQTGTKIRSVGNVKIEAEVESILIRSIKKSYRY